MIRRILFWLCVFSGLTASAQSTLSLGEATELVLENDIRLIPGKTGLKISQLKQNQSVVWDDPEIRFETGIDSKDHSVDTAVRLRFPHPWQLQADSMERASQTAISLAGMEMGRIQIATEVFQQYRNFQCLEKELALIRRLIEIKQKRSDFAREQVNAAMKTSADALLLRWELRDVQRDARVLQRELGLLKNWFAERVARPVESLQLDPLPDLEMPDFIDYDIAIQFALELRPDLHLMNAQLQQAQALVRQADVERIPWFNHVQASYDESSEEWSIQTAVSLPIFSFGGSKKRQALAEQTLQKASIDASQDAIARQVQQAAREWTSAIEEWQMHHGEFVELTGETGKEVEMLRKYVAGAPDDWMRLQENLIRAERQLLDVRRNVHAAHANYLFTTGQTLIQE